MSLRQQNLGSIIKPGFNPLAAPTPTYAYNLFAWGSGTFGKLGIGNTTSYSSPKQVGSLTNWSMIAGANTCAVGVKTDGTLWTWGANDYGQLGLGNTTNYSSPKQVGALTSWITVAGTYYACAAIKTDGTLWTWGQNTYGELGQGNTTSYSSPKQVGSLTNWSKVGCDNYNMLAIKTDGTLWAWGSNYWGNLGIGTNSNSISSPTQVGALTNWSTIACGGSVSMAVKTDGTVWIWGYNGYGNLGLGGTTTNYSSPKQVGALTNWSNITSCDTQSVHAIKTNNTLWTWGFNAYGQLGTNNLTNVVSPVQVGALTNWSSVQHSYSSTTALKTDGTLWAWGSNGSGQLGQGNTTDRSSPVQIGASTTWSAVFVTRSDAVYALG